MQLNIKNRRAVELAHALARATGDSVTAAVAKAVEEKLDRVRPSGKTPEEIAAIIARVNARLDPIHARLRAKGVRLPTQKELDDWMYDEHGLPR